MITWLPASVSFIERTTIWSPTCWKLFTSHLFNAINSIGNAFESLIIAAIENCPHIWILLLGSVGVVSGFIVFYWPRLQLPDSPDFKLFESTHPFEVYDTRYRQQFWFEKVYTDTETFKMPIRFVWGIRPIDNGNYLDPAAHGELLLDDRFNVSAIESQQWLLEFCRDFRRQSFYQFGIGSGGGMAAMMPNCFIENFIRTMDRRCLDPMSNIDRTPCCETATFPYAPHIFDECLPKIISILYESPRYVFIPGIAGPKFGRDTIHVDRRNSTVKRPPPIVRALVVEYDSSQQYTMAYGELEYFQASVQRWFDERMRTAPPGMQNAWFTSELAFFDLQATLSRDTMNAIAIAMAVSFLVLAIVTFNVLISLFAIVTVSLTICTTIAILVLMNWKLNVLESISVSTAIGLTIDFSLHYGNYYRLCPERERGAATRYSLQRMIGPTAMAALTTGAAGAFMLPSRVLAYIQIGKFLVIVMAISWIFSTLFLMSLLQQFGPQNDFGQFRWPVRWRRRREHKRRDDEGGGGAGGGGGIDKMSADDCRRLSRGAATEKLLSGSSSGAGDMLGAAIGLVSTTPAESHELSSLTSNSIVKPISALEARPINFDRAFKSRFSMSSYRKRNNDGDDEDDDDDVDNSPTSASAITEVMPDDCDIEHLDLEY